MDASFLRQGDALLRQGDTLLRQGDTLLRQGDALLPSRVLREHERIAKESHKAIREANEARDAYYKPLVMRAMTKHLKERLYGRKLPIELPFEDYPDGICWDRAFGAIGEIVNQWNAQDATAKYVLTENGSGCELSIVQTTGHAGPVSPEDAPYLPSRVLQYYENTRVIREERERLAREERETVDRPLLTDFLTKYLAEKLHEKVPPLTISSSDIPTPLSMEEIREVMAQLIHTWNIADDSDARYVVNRKSFHELELSVVRHPKRVHSEM